MTPEIINEIAFFLAIDHLYWANLVNLKMGYEKLNSLLILFRVKIDKKMKKVFWVF